MSVEEDLKIAGIISEDGEIQNGIFQKGFLQLNIEIDPLIIIMIERDNDQRIMTMT